MLLNVLCKLIIVYIINNILMFFIIVFIYFLPICSSDFSSFSFCLHRYLFNIDCPGCGIVRALNSIMHFNIIDAYKYNYSVFALFPYLLLEITTPLYKSNKLFVLKHLTFYLFLFLMFFNYLSKIFKHLSL